jgi:hypothetical protein
MIDPVNLNIPGFDYLFFALLFCTVVALFTLVLARAEVALQRAQRTRVARNSALFESHRVEGGLEWVHVQGQHIVDRARGKRPRRRSQRSPSNLIEEAEE